jgi:hypothetical protein
MTKLTEFKREERYIVIKIKDLKYASVENKLRSVLHDGGIPTRECVVVEQDWPEYEPVWAMIEARMTGRAIEAEIASVESEPVAKLGTEWIPCMKLPVVVHVRSQREGEAHVSTREGLTPILPSDLIMRGVSGEEYPIGKEIFDKTYTLNTTPQPCAKCAEQKEYIDWLDAKDSELKRKDEALKVAKEALEQASEATAYVSHDDTVGYRVCCDVASYLPHKKDCYLREALAAIDAELAKEKGK